MKYPKQRRSTNALAKSIDFGGIGHTVTDIMYSDSTSTGGYANVTLTSNNTVANSYTLTTANNLQQ